VLFAGHGRRFFWAGHIGRGEGTDKALSVSSSERAVTSPRCYQPSGACDTAPRRDPLGSHFATQVTYRGDVRSLGGLGLGAFGRFVERRAAWPSTGREELANRRRRTSGSLARLAVGSRASGAGASLSTPCSHAAVRAHLRTFLEEARAPTADGGRLPWFVEAEFERYLACGILARGFARVRCRACGDELLVAFSCKGRGFCPSCVTRRMHDTAARLVEGVLPHVPMRQWVLSLPRWARWVLVRDSGLVSRTLDLALREIFASLRKRARRAGVRGSRAGAVSFVQRFGGALNLNVHFHCVVSDGVFARDEGGVHFVPLGAPADSELEAILRRVVIRLLAVPAFAARDAGNRAVRRAGERSVRGAAAPGSLIAAVAAPRAPLGLLGGFSLHAGVHLHANDREGHATYG